MPYAPDLNTGGGAPARGRPEGLRGFQKGPGFWAEPQHQAPKPLRCCEEGGLLPGPVAPGVPGGLPFAEGLTPSESRLRSLA